MPRRQVWLSRLRQYRRDAGGGKRRGWAVVIGDSDIKDQIGMVTVALSVVAIAIPHRDEWSLVTNPPHERVLP